MDHGALQALVAVLQADHALHVGGRGLLRGQGERDWSLGDLLATLCREVAQDFPLGGEKHRVCSQIRIRTKGITQSPCSPSY